MNLLGSIIFWSVLSGTFSLVGAAVLLIKPEKTRQFSLHFISFAAGALLAAAFLDLLPEALEAAGEQGDLILRVALAGIIIFFLIERIILRFHTHKPEEAPGTAHATPVLVLVGDAFHNMIDGAVIAAAFLTNPGLGVLTALAVAAHEIPHEIGDFSIMLHHGWSRRATLWSNVIVSLTNLAGALAVFAARDFFEPYLPFMLALTAGGFIYIAATDLLPLVSSDDHGADKPLHVIPLLLSGVLVIAVLAHYLGV